MRHRAFGILGLVLCFAACDSSSSGTGGETHWLTRCASDADCVGLQCLCGVCSVPDDGACLPDAAFSVAPPQPSDYLGFDARATVPPFAELPLPDMIVASFDASWVGTWTTSSATPCDAGGLACLRLTFDTAGRGTVTWLPPTSGTAADIGPFPPPSDPSIGYPPGIAPARYGEVAASPIPGVAYRVLDGRIDASSLSFWVSPIDLWSDWCALETSFTVATGPAEQTHRCIPEGASALDTDPGRLALCSSSCFTSGNCSTPYCTCDPVGCRAPLQSEAIPVTLTRDSTSRLVGSLSPSRSASVTSLELVPGTP